MSERPFRNEGIDGLRRRFDTALSLMERGGDAVIGRERLAELEHELLHRSTRAALQLLDEVVIAIRGATETAEPTVATHAHVNVQTNVAPMHDGAGEMPETLKDGDQIAVVEAPATARLIVNAPPGTGKTWVACQRIVWLLSQGVPAHGIWLVSFTRTAIAELRKRLGVLADADRSMHGIVAGTVDSRAWRLVNGFTPHGGAALLGGHDVSIETAIRLLQGPSHDLSERLAEVQHLIVDEAQDLLGNRALLMSHLIQGIPSDSGVTILCDDAQAIFGFSEDDDRGAEGTAQSLVDLVRSRRSGSFMERQLSRVHRTSSPRLQRIFVDVRAELLRQVTIDPDQAPSLVSQRILELRDGETDIVEEDPPGSEELLLYRRRYEVLKEASRLASTGTSFRLRTSALPKCILPWVGALLGTHASDRLSRAQFDASWLRVVKLLGPSAPVAEEAWAALRAVGSNGQGVDVRLVRDYLSGSGAPDSLLAREFGTAGPILSTIHASKGREADDVRLYVPELADCTGQRAAEEARVLFVGATRARRSLRTAASPRPRVSYLQSGRLAARTRPGRYKQGRVEIGRDGDLNPFATVWESGGGAGLAYSVQERLASRVSAVTSCIARSAGPAARYRYDLMEKAPDGQELRIGALSEEVNHELFRAAEALWPSESLKSPPYVNYLYSLGARTFVARIGDDRLDQVADPYRTTGFWLVPLLFGLPTLPFFARSNA